MLAICGVAASGSILINVVMANVAQQRGSLMA